VEVEPVQTVVGDQMVALVVVVHTAQVLVVQQVQGKVMMVVQELERMQEEVVEVLVQ
tara:strand:- start:252 stop:422 length:171 start_codon:yes stop_codon:yes gene_type:complete